MGGGIVEVGVMSGLLDIMPFAIVTDIPGGVADIPGGVVCLRLIGYDAASCVQWGNICLGGELRRTYFRDQS